MSGKIEIEVVYALPDEQILFKQSVPEGALLAAAVKTSGILEKYPEINLSTNKLGIFGKLAKADTVLRDRDRIEIYRPLIANPKEARRKRVEDGEATKKGGNAAAAA
jgi:putative ubiquitin-RnfH superfamily antitoxin RatB of RatAB toxin-antitoxin module